MKIVQINATCGMGSTGRICLAVSELLNERGIENYILYSQGESEDGIKYADDTGIKLRALKAAMLGNYGFSLQSITKRLLRELDRLQPDIVQLHNIHSHNCDLGLLFTYLKANRIKVFWTFHDCWAFTGYCTYFDMSGCEKWKTGCEACPQKRHYSWFFDRSAELYRRKKELFSDIDLTVITPSDWLASLVKQSFLAEYPVRVINNGIDLEVFKPTESDFRKVHGIADDEFMLLGAAYKWEKRKGMDTFIELSRRLEDRYRIALVGTDSAASKALPDNIISVRRTESQRELAKIYTAADLFVNPTMEETFGLVNAEALACGTPVVTFDTGGCAEIIDRSCGVSVLRGDITALEESIRAVCSQRPFSESDCIKRAAEFDMRKKYREYTDLYLEAICEKETV